MLASLLMLIGILRNQFYSGFKDYVVIDSLRQLNNSMDVRTLIHLSKFVVQSVIFWCTGGITAVIIICEASGQDC
jgi:uncharacterized protein HemY